MIDENIKNNEIRIRTTLKDKLLIEENSKKFGFETVSEYLRYIGKNVKELEIKL